MHLPLFCPLAACAYRYATEWFMTLYTRGFSFELVTRIFDIFITEGDKVSVYHSIEMSCVDMLCYIVSYGVL